MNLVQGHSDRAVAVLLLNAAHGQHTFADHLGGQMLAHGLAACGLVTDGNTASHSATAW